MPSGGAGTTDLRDGPEALFAMGAPWAIPTVECPEVTVGRAPPQLVGPMAQARRWQIFVDAAQAHKSFLIASSTVRAHLKAAPWLINFAQAATARKVQAE